jgi:hypothetical protein
MLDDIPSTHRNFVEPPESTPHAILRVVTKGHVRIYPKSTCYSSSVPGSGVVIKNYIFPIGAEGFNGQSRGIALPYPADSWAEVRLTAEQPVVIHHAIAFDVKKERYACEVKLTFVPKTGRHYLNIGDVDYNKISCQTKLMDISSDSQPTFSIRAERCKN